MFSVSEKNIYWAVNWNNWMFLQVFDREISEDFNLQYYLYCFVHQMKINLCKPLKSININSRVRYFSDYIWLMAELWMSISQKIRTIICQAPININKEMYISEYMDYLSIKMSVLICPTILYSQYPPSELQSRGSKWASDCSLGFIHVQC